jgi:AmmeMemoRadiSam system protein A
MSTCFSALMCHAPIVVPAVGGARGELCARTTRAMREVAERAVASAPDRLVLVSPHTPRHLIAWGAWTGRHRGDLAAFGAPEVAVELPDAPEVAAAVGAEPVQGTELDHGAMVPLAFLWEAGWRGPTALLGLPWDEAPDSEAVGRAVAALPGRTAVIASGDMSHRLKPGAPSGFDPRAQGFDDAFVAGLRAEDWAAAAAAEQRSIAAEDVVDSARVAMAAAPGPRNAEVLSYEGPWGVGYTEAVFFDPAPPLYAVARRAIRAGVRGERFAPPKGGGEAAAVFVTLHLDGQLRGCIGSTAPVEDDLYGNVAWAADGAAFRDPRFGPVREHELDDLQIEVSVLEPPEPIAGPEALDPAVYGVVVTSGARRGLLLPGIEGVDTVEDQVAIARRKGGIFSDDPVRLERFRVRKVEQPW